MYSRYLKEDIKTSGTNISAFSVFISLLFYYFPYDCMFSFCNCRDRKKYLTEVCCCLVLVCDSD